MKPRFPVVLLVLASLVLAAATPAGAEVIIEFSDIRGHNSEIYIRALLYGSIVEPSEDRRFRPDEPVTRLDFAVWTARALELEAPEVAEPPFRDWDAVPEQYRPQVAAVRAAGLIEGYADGTFRPAPGLTRVEMALILGRYLVGLGVKPETRQFLRFSDGQEVPGWAADASAAVRTGVILPRPGVPGAPGRFAPFEAVTRAEAAQMVIRFRDVVQEISPMPRAPVTPPSVLPRAIVLAYFVNTDSAYQSLLEHGSGIDILAYVSYSLSGAGELAGVDSPRTMAWAAAKGRPVLAMLGNHDRAVNSRLLNSPAARQRAIQALLGLMDRGYSGVDLNFENLDPADRTAYTSFVAEVVAALRPGSYLVTTSVPARNAAMMAQTWATAYDYAGLGRLVDYMLVMTYDQHYSTSVPGPVGALNWASSVMAYATSQVAPSKLLLGIPSYGYQWPENGGRATAIFARSAIARAEELGIPLVPDPVTAELTFRYRHPETGIWYRVWVTEPKGLAMKLGLIAEYNLGGLGMWRVGYEPPTYWEEFRRALLPRR
ncbi:MAG: S-layer homology domain-containing protein [bacterium]|nr:S-layer homology domain-containing protein [bacterium]